MKQQSRYRCLKGFECAANGGLHRFSDAVETFTEASRCTADVPAETKSDVFGCSPSELEAKSRSDASGMRHQAIDMDAAVMIWVRISQTAGHAHGVSDTFVHELRI